MSLLENKIWRLQADVLNRTRDGKLKWTGGEGDAFTVATPSGTLMISSRDKDGSAPFVFAVFDPDGVTIGHVTDDNYQRYEGEMTELEQLHELARMTALDIDDRLQRLRADLGLDDSEHDDEVPI